MGTQTICIYGDCRARAVADVEVGGRVIVRDANGEQRFGGKGEPIVVPGVPRVIRGVAYCRGHAETIARRRNARQGVAS